MLSAFADNSGTLIGLDTTILNQIISLDLKNAIAVIKELVDYPLWRLDRGLLQKILAKPYPAESLWILNNTSEAFLQKIYDSPNSDKVLRTLKQYPELLRSEKITLEMWEKILTSPDPGELLKDLSKLLENEKLTKGLLDKIIASSKPDGVLKALETYPKLLENEKLTKGLLDKNYCVF